MPFQRVITGVIGSASGLRRRIAMVFKRTTDLVKTRQKATEQGGDMLVLLKSCLFVIRCGHPELARCLVAFGARASLFLDPSR